jgi:hypothetical protein
MTRPYYTTDHRRAWQRIQAIYAHDRECGLRLAAAFGRKLAARDLRRESKSKHERTLTIQTRTLVT